MVSPLEMVKPTDLVEHALRKMVEKNVGCILIGDKEKLMGIITERDISRGIINDPENLKRSEQNAKKIGPYVKAGLTWWLESLYIGHYSVEKMRKRIRMGPPKF